jgi:hypothetical protein
LSKEGLLCRASRRPPPPSFDTLVIVHPNAAGLDIGSSEIVAALPTDRLPTPVRAFSSFTPDLHALVDWLVAAKIDTVVLESTDVYWVPIFDLLEQRGLRPPTLPRLAIRLGV